MSSIDTDGEPWGGGGSNIIIIVPDPAGGLPLSVARSARFPASSGELLPQFLSGAGNKYFARSSQALLSLMHTQLLSLLYLYPPDSWLPSFRFPPLRSARAGGVSTFALIIAMIFKPANVSCHTLATNGETVFAIVRWEPLL